MDTDGETEKTGEKQSNKQTNKQKTSSILTYTGGKDIWGKEHLQRTVLNSFVDNIRIHYILHVY